MDHDKSEDLRHDYAWLSNFAPKLHTASDPSAAPLEVPVAATAIGIAAEERKYGSVIENERNERVMAHTLSDLIKLIPLWPEPTVRPPPPEGTVLAKIFSPIRVTDLGIELESGVYNSAALRLLASQATGPIFVNVANDPNPETVFVRGADGWIAVPRVSDAT